MDVSLRKREDAAGLLLSIIRPLKPYYTEHHAFLNLGHTGVLYGGKTAGMEGFARVLWGLAPLWSADNSSLPPDLQTETEEWLDWYKEGFIYGTDPESSEYWGDFFDCDQKMVETAAIAFTIALNPGLFWDEFTDTQKKNLYFWLDQINDYDMPRNNWRYFRIFVNMAFELLGLDWNRERMDEDLAIIDGCYKGNGWYCDGDPAQIDYYVSYAIHHYGLVYSALMKDRDPERCSVLKERSRLFFDDFVYWFANDGNEIPFGRSLTYRFAHTALFASLPFAGVDVDYGVCKNLILRNLETWLKRPIFDNAGILTVGYGYPNMFMSENYNSCGSPYWSLKPFLILAMDDDHPFWKAEPKEYPYEKRKYLPYPHMIITHDEHDHVLSYVTGQHCGNDHGMSAEKYEKFVYSNQFAFSVSRGDTLERGAFDNTIAFSRKGENRFCMRYGMTDFHTDDEKLVMRYSPIKGVEVVSTIVPLDKWHVRVHRITTDEDITVAEGGFAMPVRANTDADAAITTEDAAIAAYPWGCSLIVNKALNAFEASEITEESELTPKVINPFSNTNLLYNLTVIPMLTGDLEAGTHLLISCAAADMYESLEALEEIEPDVEISEGSVKISQGNKVVTI